MGMFSRFLIVLSSLVVLCDFVAVPEADACGVKMALKRPKQRKAKSPVATEDRPVVAQRQARTPIAAGPTNINPRRTLVEAKPSVPATPVASAVAKVDPQRVPITASPRPPKEENKKPVAKPVPVATTAPKVAATTVPSKVEMVRPDPISELVQFSANSAAIEETASLEKTVAWLLANTNERVAIEGHADPSGSPVANLILARSRAFAVRDYLISKHIGISRIDIKFFGDTAPKFDGSDARNRRVSIEAIK
jgi:outer membrane protein OmpA-like peptidoglycan-associated protein